MEREISIIGEDIRAIYPEFDNNDQLSFDWELYIDVDKYFGTDTRNTDGWINFYTFYHRSTDSITANFTIEWDDRSEYREWELTNEEIKYLREKMDECCIEDGGLSLKEYFDKYINE